MNIWDKILNTSARPEGFLGRFNLWGMNLTHTPMAKWNMKFIDWQPQWTVLDIGCGGGKNIQRMLKKCKGGKVYGVDISEESVKYSIKTNRRHIGTRCFVEQGNVLQLPYDDEMFDIVTAYETVYFWPDLEKAFAEVYRVLKNDGIFTFSYGIKTAAMMRYWEKHVEDMYLLPTEEIQKILTKTGFSDIKIAVKDGASINLTMRKA